MDGFGEFPFGLGPFGLGAPAPPATLTAERIRILPLMIRRNRQIPIATARTAEPSPLATARDKEQPGIAVARDKE